MLPIKPPTILLLKAMKYARSKKNKTKHIHTAGRIAMRLMNVHFPVSLCYDCNDPGAYAISFT